MKIFVIILFLLSMNAYGLDLSKSWAVGAGTKGLSLKYFPNQRISVALFAYFHNTSFEKEVINNYSVWLKTDYIFHSENYMNFYYSFAFNYRGPSFLEAEILLGGELFFENWPNLGFDFSFGLGFSSTKKHFQVKTVKNLPFNSGINYYF